MPTELRNNQHELTTEDGAVSLVFGTEDTGFLTTTHPAYGSTDARTGDVERVREDGIALGEDYLGGKSVTYEIGVLTDRALDPHRAGLDALNAIEGAWTDERFRDRSSKYAVLRTCVAGRTTRTYGRPRRYEEQAGQLTRKGYTPIVADFLSVDGRWYDDVAQVQSVPLVAGAEGGLTAPLTAPLTTTGSSTSQTAITVGGSKRTWPVARFHGPVKDPELDFGTFVIGLSVTIPDGMTITVDTRPWVRTVTRNDGANQAGALTYRTPPLRKCLLPVGTYEVTYRGTDATGSSYAEVVWRNAYARP